MSNNCESHTVLCKSKALFSCRRVKSKHAVHIRVPFNSGPVCTSLLSCHFSIRYQACFSLDSVDMERWEWRGGTTLLKLCPLYDGGSWPHIREHVLSRRSLPSQTFPSCWEGRATVMINSSRFGSYVSVYQFPIVKKEFAMLQILQLFHCVIIYYSRWVSRQKKKNNSVFA